MFPLILLYTNSKEMEYKENRPSASSRMNEKLVSSAAISSVFPSFAPITEYKGHLIYFQKKSGYLYGVDFFQILQGTMRYTTKG